MTRDLTERRELTEKLQQQTQLLEEQRREAADSHREAEEARLKADEANRAKSDFLASMAHELRTPLNAIGGYTESLKTGVSCEVNSLQQQQLERIKKSQEHLLGIINAILNFSRIEAGTGTYDLGIVPMNDVVDDVIDMLAPQAAAKTVSLIKGDCLKGVIALGGPHEDRPDRAQPRDQRHQVHRAARDRVFS